MTTPQEKFEKVEPSTSSNNDLHVIMKNMMISREWSAMDHNLFHVPISGIDRLSEIKELRGYLGRVVSLKGLEKCTNLHTLDITNNNVSDLTPIAKIPIRHLKIARNPVRSLSGLDFSKLETLVIDCHQLKALADVGDLSSLTYLEIDGQVRKNHPVLKALIAKNPSLRVMNLEHRQETLQMIN